MKELVQEKNSNDCAPVKYMFDRILKIIDNKFFKYLKSSGCKINIINKVIEQAHGVPASVNNTTINLYVDKVELAKNSPKYNKKIMDALCHEIGHLYFNYLILQSTSSMELKTTITKFMENSDKEGGVTFFSDQYMKEKFGKEIRAQGKYMINGVDIKHHENFAEFYKLYLLWKFDQAILKEPFDNYVGPQIKESKKAFHDCISLCN